MSVLFHRVNAFPLLDPSYRSSFGGAEVRSVKFARALAGRPEFDVSFLVRESGHEQLEDINIVSLVRNPASPMRRAFESRVHRCYQRYSEWRSGRRRCSWQLLTDVALVSAHWLSKRFIRPFPRVSDAIAKESYARITADVIVCFGMDEHYSEMLLTAALKKQIPVILCVVSDDEIAEEVRPGGGRIGGTNSFADRSFHLLTDAKHVIVQKESQRRSVARFNHNITLIRNPISLSDRSKPVDRPGFAFWIGRAEPVHMQSKRPQMFWELAYRCPEISFLAVLNPFNQSVFDELYRSKPSNLKVIDRVPYCEIESWFAAATLFVSTSRKEGFPNTFLQAAKYRVPVISLNVDPDSVLTKEGWGISCDDDLDRLADETRRLWKDAATRREMGARGCQYVQSCHDLGHCTTQLGDVIRQVVASHSVSSSANLA